MVSLNQTLDHSSTWKTRFQLPKVSINSLFTSLIGNHTMTQSEIQTKLSENTLIEMTAKKFIGLIVVIVIGCTSIVGGGYGLMSTMNNHTETQIETAFAGVSEQIEASNLEIQQAIEELRESDEIMNGRIQFLERLYLNGSQDPSRLNPFSQQAP